MSFRPPTPAPKALPPDPKRGAMRARLLAVRLELADREVRSRVISDRLLRWLRTVPVTRLAFYWPTRAEAEVTAGQLLEFAPWTPRAAMKPGDFGIQVPDTRERIKPQLLVVPCVGLDEKRYRLGYGAGFYDRTLAAFPVRPSTVGIAFDCGRVKSIDPQPHDIPLDLGLTESGAL